MLTVRKSTVGRLVVTDGSSSANITALDLLAINGVIHIIDAVLIPPTPAQSEHCLRCRVRRGPAMSIPTPKLRPASVHPSTMLCCQVQLQVRLIDSLHSMLAKVVFRLQRARVRDWTFCLPQSAPFPRIALGALRTAALTNVQRMCNPNL